MKFPRLFTDRRARYVGESRTLAGGMTYCPRCNESLGWVAPENVVWRELAHHVVAHSGTAGAAGA